MESIESSFKQKRKSILSLKNYFFYGLILCLGLNIELYADTIVNSKKINEIKTNFEQALKETKQSEERKFYLYLLAGRELFNYRFYQDSALYFNKAIDQKLALNKTEAYLKLIAIAFIQKDSKDMTKNVQMAEEYFKKNPSYLSAEIKEYLNFINTSVLKKNPKEKTAVIKGFYGHYAQLSDIQDDIKNHEYPKALSAFNEQAIENASIDLKITYDLLNVLVNKKNVGKLLCSPSLTKYPGSYSYGIMLCEVLSKFLRDGKVENKDFDKLNDYFKTTHTEKKYLLHAASELLI
jgi:hypothetical protein